MTSITLNSATQQAINLALTAGPGTNNENYIAAYNAVAADQCVQGVRRP